jgi:hypothetical protein
MLLPLLRVSSKLSDVRQDVLELFFLEERCDASRSFANVADEFVRKGSTVVYASPPAQGGAVTDSGSCGLLDPIIRPTAAMVVVWTYSDLWRS